jgi:hypothetical protein
VFGPGGDKPTYADFAILNALRAVEYMFSGVRGAYPAPLAGWKRTMEARPGVAAYLSRESVEPVLYSKVAAA